MSDVLIRIKRAVLAGGYIFTEKALLEMDADALTELDVAESILNATAINKTLRSTSPFRTARQYLYVIQSPTLDGLAIYSRQAAATISKRSAGTGMVNSRARTTPSETWSSMSVQLVMKSSLAVKLCSESKRSPRLLPNHGA